jgi:iron complex outermembrane recepter protein
MFVRARRFLPVLAGAGLLALAAEARGQGTARDTVPAAELAPVVVEVLRTPAELRRVPFSVSTVEGTALREGRPGLSVEESLRTVPGVQVDNRFNYALGDRISIRGFGARTQFGVRGVRVVVDGQPATFADGQTALEGIDPATIERVEVVRGPASAIFGNASGGVILLRTLSPPPVPLMQEVRVVGGDHGLLRVESRTAGQVRGTAYQLQASRLGFDGYRSHSTYETTSVSGLLQRRVGATEVRLTGSAFQFDAQNPGSLSRALLAENRLQAFANNVAQGTGKDGRQAQLGAWFSRPFGGVEVELAAHAQRREITNPIPNRVIDLDRTAGAVRALARGEVGLPAGTATWTVGTDLDGQWDDRQNFLNTRGERGALALDQAERVLGIGTFAQVLLPLGERFSAMGGIRADRFRFRVDDRFVTAQDPDDSGARRMSAVSPSAGIVWNAHPAADLYANVATVFETPTTTELANRPDGAGGFNPELEPQRARSLEVGARGDLGERSTYQLALYRTRIRNALIPFQVPEAQGRDFFRNAGTAVHRGVEAGLGLALLPNIAATVAYTYTDAVFDDYVVRGNRFDGNRVPGVAPHRWSTGLNYRRAAGLFAGVETVHVSSIHVDDANSDRSPAYALLNARIGHTGIRVGRAEVAPFVGLNNLLDREYNAAVTINAFGGRFFEPGPGRSLYLGTSLRGSMR